MCVPKETLIDIFNEDVDEYRVFNEGNRGGYQSMNQDVLDKGKIQIVRQDEPNGTSRVDANGERSESRQNKPKGKEETFGFNHDESQILIDQPR